MISEEIREKASRLGLAEKLLLVEDLWDSIAQSNSELPLPDWQKKELRKRYDKYKADQMNLHDWQSVHENLRKQYK